MKIINNYTYRAVKNPESRIFFSQCAEIKVTATGKTKEEALINIKKEALKHIKDMNKEDIPIPLALRESHIKS